MGLYGVAEQGFTMPYALVKQRSDRLAWAEFGVPQYSAIQENSEMPLLVAWRLLPDYNSGAHYPPILKK